MYVVLGNLSLFVSTVLTYRHELGLNYNFIRPDLIVGSCLQVILNSTLEYMSLMYSVLSSVVVFF